MISARSRRRGSWVTMTMVLLNLRVQQVEQLQDLLGALAIEIAGRLVGDEDGRIGDDGARDGHALLLPARELARVVVHAILEADHAQRGLDALLALGLATGSVRSSGSSTFWNAVSTGSRL